MARVIYAVIVTYGCFHGSLLVEADEAVFSRLPSGRELVTEIYDDAILASPAWAAEAVNPPISARKAIQVASEVKVRLVKPIPGEAEYDWSLYRVSLVPTETKDRWYWLVQYEGTPSGVAGTSSVICLNLVVLMDGKCIDPH